MVRERVKQRVERRSVRLGRIEGEIAAHQRAGLVLHRLDDVRRERIDGHQSGHAKRYGRHVKQEAPPGGAALAPGQAPDAPRQTDHADFALSAPVSSTTAPSRSLIMREARDASEKSWVTRTIVEPPSLLRDCSSSKMR